MSVNAPKKKKLTRQNGLSFYCRVKKTNGEVISRLSSKKLAVSRFVKANLQSYAQIYIRVTYKPGLTNEGDYSFAEKNEVMNAWECFTEEDLIREAINY